MKTIQPRAFCLLAFAFLLSLTLTAKDNGKIEVNIGDRFTVKTEFYASSDILQIAWDYSQGYTRPVSSIGAKTREVTFEAIRETSKWSGVEIQARIRLKSGLVKEEHWTVHVSDNSTIRLDKSSMVLSTGETGRLTTTVTNPSYEGDYKWTSSNSSVAGCVSYDDVANIYAYKAGTTTIRVELDNGNYATCNVTVTESVVYVTSVYLNRSSADLNVGNTLQLNATVYPTNATNSSVTWSSSNSSVASVNSYGLVTAKSSGTATITCRAADGSGYYDTCLITVSDSEVYVTSVTLNKSSESLEVGGTCQLTATVYPTNATNRSVTWSSSNSSVASVNSYGLVTAKSSGTATITCRAADGSGEYATCTITVTDTDSDTDSDTETVSGEVTVDNIKYKIEDGEAALVDGKSASGSVVIPSYVTYNGLQYPVATIGKNAFSNCCDLTSIIIPSGVISIGDYVFAGCLNLTYIGIPNSVISIGEGAFCYCEKLTAIEIPNSIVSFGPRIFQGCSGLTSIKIPNCVTSIALADFNSCSSMVSIDIPNSVISIGSAAFGGCTSLGSIIIPNSVTFIGSGAFFNCKSLLTVICEWTDLSKLTVDNDIFEGISTEAKLIVPKGTKAMYQATEPWSDFKYIEEMGVGTSIIDDVDAEDTEPMAIYTLDGVKVSQTEKGKVYVFHYANGKVVKRMIK